MSRYIKQSIIAPSGHSNECWRVTKLDADLESGVARLVLTGWKDGQAYVDRKLPIDTRTVTVSVADIQSYETLFTELAGMILSTSEFAGGTIEETPTPTA